MAIAPRWPMTCGLMRNFYSDWNHVPNFCGNFVPIDTEAHVFCVEKDYTQTENLEMTGDILRNCTRMYFSI